MSLYRLTIHELQEKLHIGEISSADIVKALFSRIAATEDKAQAFITLCEESALEAARCVDKKADYAGIKGIPYGLKDSFCTRGIRTTGASKYLENFVPSYEATASRLLNKKGGILLGKLNLDEFAMGTSNELSVFFPSRNPWDWERVPGGSSGGSAAAVAAGQVPLALATDTGGSTRQPASYCGIVGLKPSYGRVSRWGVMAVASSLDQVGILTRDVRDCATILGIIAGKDQLDATSAADAVPDYNSALSGGIKGLRIAYPREYFQPWVAEGIRSAVLRALRKFEELGAIVEEVSLPHSEYALPAYYIIAPAEISANLARFDGVRYGLRDAEADNIVDMFSRSRAQGFGPEVKRRIILGTYALSAGNYEKYYIKAMQVRRLIAQDFVEVYRNFDLIVTPTTPTTAFKLKEQKADSLTLYMNDALTVPANMAGLPAISIPCALDKGLPVGLQLIGKAFDEATLLKAAYAFEQNTDYHRLTPVPGGGINE